MSILREVLSELFGMFVSDARVTGALLAVIAVSATAFRLTGSSELAGGLLLCGSLAALVAGIRRDARNRQ